MYKLPDPNNQASSSKETLDLFENEIEALEHMRIYGIKYDRNKRNQKHIKLIAITMSLIALTTALYLVLNKQPAIATAILFGWGGGYLINIQKPTTGA